MLTENEVIESVAVHLAAHGWRIEQKLTTVQRGIDIIASRDDPPRRLLVEAKGGTSSKEHTDRYGKGFNGGQVRSHVAGAFYCAARLQAKHHGDEVSVALPDDDAHRACIESIAPALAKLGISVFLVAADGSVRMFDTAASPANENVGG